MQTLNAFVIVLTFLLAGLVLFYAALKLAEKGMNKQIPIRSIFQNFGQKMWMTIGIGSVFFLLYLFIIAYSSRFNDSITRLDFFFLVYEYPTAFIYLGLLAFASFSTGIYLVRLVIKFLYNTKSKY